ncbi:hypothetical protein DK419_17390 [Methylobacterium terrae]|uniref:Uncharacterized protein n=1 Tax=Methylobacterium terrae TaxID=2202827 RepID=A0A2U8WP49_9HYPH|nr:hypothetical protein [Methylobacterium terrae]AWN47877.1 hypothetical protein DK419_17390 [Methylobacterium terrae]
MRAGLVLGLVGLGIVAAANPAEARGRRGGGFFVTRSHAAPAEAPATRAQEAPRMRTAAAAEPEPMTTGTTTPVAAAPTPRAEAAPAPAPAPARPWCTGRVFGSGAGFCAIN